MDKTLEQILAEPSTFKVEVVPYTKVCCVTTENGERIETTLDDLPTVLYDLA